MSVVAALVWALWPTVTSFARTLPGLSSLTGLSSSGAGPAMTGATAATGLDAELAARFDQARDAAKADGVNLVITSGWRSAAEQQQIVDQMVKKYGSLDAAKRWVLPPSVSEHVKGRAIDVAKGGAAWLERNGSRFGLCRTYANEAWHFEPVIKPGQRCPAMHPDASHGWS